MFSDGRNKSSIIRSFVDVTSKAKVLTTPGCKGAAFTSRREGYLAEFAIDKASAPISEDGRLYFNAVLYKGLQELGNVSSGNPQLFSYLILG
jgi:hypothetical protein